MSGKSARRLRRLTEQALNTPQGSTTAAHNDGNYKEHPVMRKEKAANRNKAAMTKTIRLDRKDPRAFYQETKRLYKTGEAHREAMRIEKEHKQAKLDAAKKFANDLENIVEGKTPAEAVVHIAPASIKVKFSDWVVEKQHPLAACVPFDIQATPDEMERGIITAIAKDATTGRTAMFKVNGVTQEFAVKQETEIESWRKFQIEKFGNDVDEFYKAIADEINTLLHLLAEPVATE
jgi:hypothetical protein